MVACARSNSSSPTFPLHMLYKILLYFFNFVLQKDWQFFKIKNKKKIVKFTIYT
jgi:hypothetical protein